MLVLINESSQPKDIGIIIYYMITGLNIISEPFLFLIEDFMIWIPFALLPSAKAGANYMTGVLIFVRVKFEKSIKHVLEVSLRFRILRFDVDYGGQSIIHLQKENHQHRYDVGVELEFVCDQLNGFHYSCYHTTCASRMKKKIARNDLSRQSYKSYWHHVHIGSISQ